MVSAGCGWSRGLVVIAAAADEQRNALIGVVISGDVTGHTRCVERIIAGLMGQPAIKTSYRNVECCSTSFFRCAACSAFDMNHDVRELYLDIASRTSQRVEHSRCGLEF
jgi:hypothetical protein